MRRSQLEAAALVVAGAAVLAHALGGQAREAWAQVRLRRALERGEVGAMEVAGARVAPRLRVAIGELGLDVVVVEPARGTSVDDALRAGAVLLPGRADGPLVLSAHRDTHFRLLEGVSVGMAVEVEGFRAGRYGIAELRVVEPDDLSALDGLGADVLVLSTCWPLRHLGPAPQRLLVIAKRNGCATRGGSDQASSRPSNPATTCDRP